MEYDYQDKWPVKKDLFDEIHGNPVPNILSRHKMLSDALDGWNRSGWSFEHMAQDIGVYLGRLLTKRESDHLATISELTRERDELREASRWISVDMARMDAGYVCDLWEPLHGRLANYRLVKNYANKSGNHFFEPVSSGVSCVRTATHYMEIPKGPKT